MTLETSIRAARCLRYQNEKMPADAPWLRYREAYIVGEEIYLEKHAAESAMMEQGRRIEVLKYADACQIIINNNAKEREEEDEQPE